MAQQTVSITVHVRPRWWFGPVLKLLLAVRHVTGWTPSKAVTHALAKHGVRYLV